MALTTSNSDAPLTLSIDTAEKVLVVCIARGEELLAEQTVFTERSHARLVTVVIDELLHHLELSPNDLDHIGVVIGPGSYTGIRIGIAAAKGLALALDKPLVGVPTTALLAAGALLLNLAPSTQLIGMLHARKREAYVGVYDTELHTLREPTRMEVDSAEFQALVQRQPAMLLGSGAALLDRETSHFWPHLPNRAQALATAAHRIYAHNGTSTAEQLQPLYLKAVKISKPKRLL